MSRRLKVVIPNPAGEQLDQLARESGEPAATLAARFIVQGMTRGAASPQPLSPRKQARIGNRRPSWLPPSQDLGRWRSDTWAKVSALHQRYPRHLAGVQDGWWGDPAQLETLAALAAWRGELDHAGEDPREELLFHVQLADYQQTLEAHRAGVANAWQPDAPPPDWAS